MKLRPTTKAVLLVFRSGLAMGTASIAGAQEAQQPPNPGAQTVEGIVGTGTKREAALKDVPFSINAQTEEDIQRSGAVTLEDLSRNVAGLAIQNLGPGQSQVSIRGVSSGQIVRDQPGVKEQVGVYLDETAISMSLFTPDIDLFDLKRVETLRGPQGTLFGAGNIGGTIRYITNEPRLRVSEGTVETNVNTISGGGTGGSLKGALNVPLGDAAAMRLVACATHFGGWTHALGPQRHHRLQGLHAGIALELERQGPAAMGGRRLLCRQRPQVCPAPSDSGLRRLYKRSARRRNDGGGGQRLRAGFALQRRPSLQPEAVRAVRRGELRLDQPADGNGGAALPRLTRRKQPLVPTAAVPPTSLSPQ